MSFVTDWLLIELIANRLTIRFRPGISIQIARFNLWLPCRNEFHQCLTAEFFTTSTSIGWLQSRLSRT